MDETPVIARIRGVEIRAHASLLLVPPYLAFLAATSFPALAALAGIPDPALALPAPVWGLLLGLLLVASLVVHEAGHVLLVRAGGGRIVAITLLAPGGRVEVRGLARTGRNEVLTALIGPVTSLAAGVLLLGLRELFPAGDVGFGLAWAAYLNLGLGALNLLPGHPMDGGRVLQAALATQLPRVQAVRWAARAGVFAGAGMLVVALATGTLLPALLAALVWAGVRAELASLRREERARALVVRDVMAHTRTVVESHVSIAEAGARLAKAKATALPVVEGPVLLGVVAVRHLHVLPPELRERTPVAAVTATGVPRLHADEPLPVALARMAEHHVQEAPVLDRGRLVGVLETGSLGRALDIPDPAAIAEAARPRLAPPPAPAPQPIAPPPRGTGWPGARPGIARA